jgi:hypothetical protein
MHPTPLKNKELLIEDPLYAHDRRAACSLPGRRDLPVCVGYFPVMRDDLEGVQRAGT